MGDIRQSGWVCPNCNVTLNKHNVTFVGITAVFPSDLANLYICGSCGMFVTYAWIDRRSENDDAITQASHFADIFDHRVNSHMPITESTIKYVIDQRNRSRRM